MNDSQRQRFVFFLFADCYFRMIFESTKSQTMPDTSTVLSAFWKPKHLQQKSNSRHLRCLNELLSTFINFYPPQPATVAFKKWRTMFSSYVDTFFLPFLQILHSNSYHQGYYICLVGYPTQTFICYFFGTTPSTRWAPEPIVTYGVIRHRHM